MLAETARDDVRLLFRAGRHLAAAGNDDLELQAVFARWVRSLSRRGNRRGVGRLAEDLLGDIHPSEKIASLAASLPLRIRVGLTSSRWIAAAAALVFKTGTIGRGAHALARPAATRHRETGEPRLD